MCLQNEYINTILGSIVNINGRGWASIASERDHGESSTLTPHNSCTSTWNLKLENTSLHDSQSVTTREDSHSNPMVEIVCRVGKHAQ
jgi:hypothetical protein